MGVRPFHLLSGAGHDAMSVATLTPVAMLFIRCAGGRQPQRRPNRSTAADVDVACPRPDRLSSKRLGRRPVVDDSRREIDPPQRLLMGPGPANAHPRVLRAMSAQLLGQFDPEFTGYMNETMALYRQVFQTANRWTFVIDGTSRAAIEAAMVSVLEPGDRVVVGSSGRFGGLLTEIAERCGGEVTVVAGDWGAVIPFEAVEAAVASVKPRLVALVHGDTSTTMAQPLEGLGALCRAHGALSYVDATATLGGMDLAVDALGLDIVTAGLQKCLGGPSGSAPITLSDRAADHIFSRRHVERGLATAGGAAGAGPRISSNYFDLAMVMDYWSERRLNHHTESTTMLYAARECARLVLEEGWRRASPATPAAGRP